MLEGNARGVIEATMTSGVKRVPGRTSSAKGQAAVPVAP